MAKTRLVIDHDDGLAALATWYKAVFLTPIWAFLVIMPFGAMMRNYFPAYDLQGFLLITFVGLVYFIRDLTKRRIVIDDTNITFSLTSAPLAELQSIEVASYKWSFLPVFLPRSLLLKFESGQTMEFMLTRVNQPDLEELVAVINRRVSHCKINPDVDEILRRRRPLSVMRLDNPDKFEAQYHSSRMLEELPQILKRTARNWARFIGPIGTFLLTMPFWLVFNMQMYHVLRNYADVVANQKFYEFLVMFLMSMQYIANGALAGGGKLSMAVAESPVVTVIVTTTVIALMIQSIQHLLGANQLTIDNNEISLDRFFKVFSFTERSAKWENVAQVKLVQPKDTADPNMARIEFFDKADKVIMSISMGALSARDRERLSIALEKFCGEARVASTLTEALEPSRDKSYTELWLKSLTDTPARRKLEPLAPGHLLEHNRYEIECKLAVGGEGVAYLGRDLQGLNNGSSESVVLKETLIPPFVDKQVQKRALERFEREARMLKELESDYVVGLRQYFIEDHRCYLVLDYVEGQNLRQYIAQRGAMPEEMVLDLADQMCEMLAFLHGKGVIHRDFTPDNLILQEDGLLKLIDFNVARENDDGKTGTIVGKHAYVPPEQFRGKPTCQSDIYALGATLQFLLTGKDPEPISQSSPAATNPKLSDSIDTLVRNCTALDTAKRLAIVEDVRRLCRESAGSASKISSEGALQEQIIVQPDEKHEIEDEDAPVTIKISTPEKGDIVKARTMKEAS